MRNVKLLRLIGVSGVASSESARTRFVGKCFEWLMLCIVFWLPFQWYFSYQGYLGRLIAYQLDWLIWLAFIAESIVLGCMVKRKLYYYTGNWLNFVIIIFAFPWLYSHHGLGLTALRFVRLIVIVRLILPWLHNVHDMLTLNRIGVTLFVFLSSIGLSGVLISSFDSGIKSPFEGVWWAWETVTTVGYGDVVPTTVTGKLIAMMVMLLGIVLLSVVTATISAYFMRNDTRTHLYALSQINHDRLENLEKILLNSPHFQANFAQQAEVDEFVQRLSKKERACLLRALQKIDSP